VVSVLFTAAGIQFALEGAGLVEDTLYLLLMFPFWLWGPLLGLATWAYAMNRATPGASGVNPALAPTETVPGTESGERTRSARFLFRDDLRG
jgi:hypothetical protein